MCEEGLLERCVRGAKTNEEGGSEREGFLFAGLGGPVARSFSGHSVMTPEGSRGLWW